MKIKNIILSLALASSVLMSSTLSVSALDTNKAKKYAQNHYTTNKTNAYTYFDYDCINFCNQCIHEGGIGFRSTWYNKGGSQVTTTWSQCNSFFKEFCKNPPKGYSKVSYYVVNTSYHLNKESDSTGKFRRMLNNVSSGDIVQLCDDSWGENAYHSIFIGSAGSVTNGKSVEMYGHTSYKYYKAQTDNKNISVSCSYKEYYSNGNYKGSGNDGVSSFSGVSSYRIVRTSNCSK